MSAHIVDVPVGGVSVALSNRSGADLPLAPEIVAILDRDAASLGSTLDSPEARVVWAAHSERDRRIDRFGDEGRLHLETGNFLSQLGCSPARLSLRVSSPEILTVLNSAFGTAEGRTPLGRRLDTFGNRDQVTIEVCGDSKLDPATLAKEYGLPVVDRRGTPAIATAPTDKPAPRYRPAHIASGGAGYSPARTGRVSRERPW
ncbi:MAG: hypothetical protein ACRDTD_28260 [Pseudonocardiaceae bacterium]